MVLGGIARSLARAGRSLLVRQTDDANLSFIAYSRIPELRTLAVAPDEVHGEFLDVSFSHEHRRLRIVIHGEQEVTFVFREEDIMVLAEAAFEPEIFRERLRAAARATRVPREGAALPHSLSHG